MLSLRLMTTAFNHRGVDYSIGRQSEREADVMGLPNSSSWSSWDLFLHFLSGCHLRKIQEAWLATWAKGYQARNPDLLSSICLMEITDAKPKLDAMAKIWKIFVLFQIALLAGMPLALTNMTLYTNPEAVKIFNRSKCMNSSTSHQNNTNKLSIHQWPTAYRAWKFS